MFEEDLELAAQNRMNNLMWTVSGDYAMQAKLDLKNYDKLKYSCLYDAVKQGAFARFFDRNALGLYLVRKLYCGAQEQPLTELTQLCVDAACIRLLTAQRPGTEDLRRKAFEETLDLSFSRLSQTLPGRLKLAMIRKALAAGIPYTSVCGKVRADFASGTGERRMEEALARIEALQGCGSTQDVIAAVDDLYNSLIDRGFAARYSLAQVQAVTLEELEEFDWSDFLEEELGEEALERYLNRLGRQAVSMQEEPDQEENRQKDTRRRVTVITEEAAAKMYSYMELNYGKSYLSEQEQKRRNARLCRGAHVDCQLYYTDGILSSPVKSNAQYVNARRHTEKNRVAFRNSQNLIKRSIEQLTGELKRTLISRSEPETRLDFTGAMVPRLLWKAGRLEDPGRLFQKTRKLQGAGFAVDLLMDASGSQRERQSQIALQAYIISEALSNNRIPHRITSFCSFWDYTILQRLREYDDPREKNLQILNYVTSANNRDGLAIRAVGDDLLQRPEDGKILIVLSDGKPNDIIVNRPGSRNPRPYYGEYAVRDTAFEVRHLRSSGVCVLGVFTGKEKELSAEKRIFGKDFAYIRSIEGFSRVVGHYLRRLLENEDGFF